MCLQSESWLGQEHSCPFSTCPTAHPVPAAVLTPLAPEP